MLSLSSPRFALLVIFAVMLAAITGAWIFEYLGFVPCELCLMQRWAYYAVLPMSLLLFWAAPRFPRLLMPGLIVIGLILLGNAIFGVYHAGVEWKWWQGPTTCGGSANLPTGLPDFTKKVVLCNEAALRIFGLSLAGWNAVICGGLSILAFWAAGKTTSAQGSSSVSQ